MDYKEIFALIGFFIGLISVFVKNENRITQIETTMKATLNELVKKVDELKSEKQDKTIYNLELSNLRNEIVHLERNLKQQLEYVNDNVEEIKTLLINQKRS